MTVAPMPELILRSELGDCGLKGDEPLLIIFQQDDCGAAHKCLPGTIVSLLTVCKLFEALKQREETR